MAFDEVTRGVRGLIRSVLQERCIKHHSTPRFITTICYAQTPLESIEYYGPIRFLYGDDLIVYVYGMPMEPDLYYTEIEERVKFDLAAPDLDVQLTSLLDRYIDDKHKRPDHYKTLVRSTSYQYCFIPDRFDSSQLQHRFPLFPSVWEQWWLKARRWWRRLWGALPLDDKFCWLQAIQRHFKVSAEEAAVVTETVQALRESDTDKSVITTATAEILKNRT